MFQMLNTIFVSRFFPPCRKYRNITSLEQRLKYKEEFNNLYPQYREHHKFIEGIKQKFKGLKDELYHTKKDSEAYDYLQDKVIEEYNKITQVTIMECSPGSGKCAYIVCGVNLNPMTGVIIIMSVKRLGTSLDQCIERYINTEYYYYYYYEPLRQWKFTVFVVPCLNLLCLCKKGEFLKAF